MSAIEPGTVIVDNRIHSEKHFVPMFITELRLLMLAMTSIQENIFLL
jgi:hypothetical protein